MDEGDAPRRLRALPSWLLARTALLGARTVTAHLEEAGMRRAHYALLVALREDGPASQAALGRRLAADRSDMHRTVGELESRGLIAREPDPDDRRRNLVTLTGARRRRPSRTSTCAWMRRRRSCWRRSPRTSATSS